MKQRTYRLTAAVLASGLAGVAGLPSARAQDPAAPPSAEYTLAFQHRPGRFQKLRLATVGDLILTTEDDAGMALGTGPLPFATKMTNRYTEKVIGAQQGIGTLIVRLDSMLVDTTFMGRTSTVKVENGQVTSVDGQPAPGGPGAAVNSLQPLVVQRDSRGVVTTADGGNLAGTAGNGILQLPEQPVKIGDAWEVVQQVAVAVPGPGGEAAPPLDMRLRHTLKDVVTTNEKQFALIESKGSGSSPQEAPGPAVRQILTGTSRFDLARGALVSGQYLSQLFMEVDAPAPAGAAGGPSKIKIEGVVTISVAEILAAPAKPAPKPAARKRSSRK